MYIKCIIIAILLVFADGFTVRGPSGPLVVPLGSSVVLPCYVDKPLPVEDLEVEWRRTDSGTLVHLFLNGEIRAEVQQQEYQDRAHFFTDQIQRGNFSLRLDNLRAEDQGNYRCKVYSQQDSGETVVQIKYFERLRVFGSSRSISAYVGEDVTLNCFVDSYIKPEHIEVLWKRTDVDILVLLYQNYEALPDSDEQYRDRVEFFTDEIPKGNFSLRLKSVRTEDKGVYMCEAFAGGVSASTTVALEQLGFSSFHNAVLFFCITAASGAVLLLFCLIYCRSKNTVNSRTIWSLQLSLVFFPNVCMFFAFILWGLTEGFLHETITCCALYFLRPVMLIWALSYLKYLQDNIKTWIRFFTITTEFTVFTVVVFSVLFTYAWGKRAHDLNIISRLFFGLDFGFVVLFCLLLIGVDFIRSSQEWPGADASRKQTEGVFYWINLLSFGQFIQLGNSFGFPSLALVYVALLHLLLLICIQVLSCLEAKVKCLRRWITSLRIIVILLDVFIVTYIHPDILEREKDYLGWTCVFVFMEVLKMIVVIQYYVTDFNTDEESSGIQRRQQTETSQQESNTLHLCNFIMYMSGAVGLVLLNSVTLTAELIMKARNGERVLKDLRVIVFPSECVFALYWLISLLYAFYLHTIKGRHLRDTAVNSGNTSETHEMENLSAPDSAVSQTQ